MEHRQRDTRLSAPDKFSFIFLGFQGQRSRIIIKPKREKLYQWKFPRMVFSFVSGRKWRKNKKFRQQQLEALSSVFDHSLDGSKWIVLNATWRRHFVDEIENVSGPNLHELENGFSWQLVSSPFYSSRAAVETDFGSTKLHGSECESRDIYEQTLNINGRQFNVTETINI